MIIYDVNTRKSEVREAMISSGYYKYWYIEDANKNSIKYYLPENSVWTKDVEFKKALEDINRVIERLNNDTTKSKINLQRCIVLSVTPWDGIVGQEV